ncbi:MAG: efflux RND transporter periplasmic adaptor subunit [Planctomycetes bacterium]|jgi:RND family efflux transporter MFP subunit|nr:efflux RND transporter periplasmic adaptor subunit [Planctomycetota bacterium]
MNPASNSTVPAPTENRQPPKAWRTFRLLVLLLIVGGSMLFIGDRFGQRIGATLRQMWSDITGSKPHGESKEASNKFYTCGMHPWVILPEPGLCPICHMDLTPLDPAKFTGEIAIDPVLAQNIGVRTALVETGPLVGTVRTVGKVDYDETRLHDVNLKVAGWIEELHVDFLGANVEKGQALFELYAPELFSAQQDYVLALQQQQLPGVVHVPRVAEDAVSGLQATRTRLTYFGIDDEQIEALAKTRQPRKTMTIKSPISGTVIRKMAVAGMRVDPGMQMYRIADLTKVWVTVTVYEYQLPFVELGQEATMTLSYIPGEEFPGRVTYVYPWTDEKTREVNVRLEFDNDSGLLKPGMFANVQLRRTLAAERTLVSRSAVIDTGERQVAFVSLGGGRFEPRSLRLGIETDGGKVEVVDGLKPGERVVTSAQFLLDSESKIREGLLRMIRGDLVGSEQESVAGPELDALPPDLAAAVGRTLSAYLQIGSQLASDTTTGIGEQARSLAQGVDAMLAVAIPGHEHFWHQHDEAATIRGKALELAGLADLAAARLAFYDLSIAFGKLLRATGVPSTHEQAVEELHCPMFREDQGGAIWLQEAGAVRNPYFGSKMLSCFDRRSGLPHAEAGSARGETAAVDNAVDAIVASYLGAADALAQDRTDGLPEAWGELRKSTQVLAGAAQGKTAELAKRLAAAVPADNLDLAATREAFQNLSNAVIDLLRVAPAGRALERAFCPMVEASWLQSDKQLRNPYMGAEMLECGSVKETLPARKVGERDAGGRGR